MLTTKCGFQKVFTTTKDQSTKHKVLCTTTHLFILEKEIQKYKV